jgi:hypothetical protein
MMPETHPVLKALRALCAGNLPLYEALIAEIKEYLFEQNAHGVMKLNDASLRQFLEELWADEAQMYTRAEVMKMIAKTQPEWAEKLFSRPKGKPPKSY